MEQAVSERFPFRLVPVRGPMLHVELGTPSQHVLRGDELGPVRLPGARKRLAEESATVWATVFSYAAGRASLHKEFVESLRASLLVGSPFAEIFLAFEQAAASYTSSLPLSAERPAMPVADVSAVLPEQASDCYPFRLVPVRVPMVRIELGTPRQRGLREDEVWSVLLHNGQKRFAEESAPVWATVFSVLAGRALQHKEFVETLRASLAPGSPFAGIFLAFEQAAASYISSLPLPPA